MTSRGRHSNSSTEIARIPPSWLPGWVLQVIHSPDLVFDRRTFSRCDPCDPMCLPTLALWLGVWRADGWLVVRRFCSRMSWFCKSLRKAVQEMGYIPPRGGSGLVGSLCARCLGSHLELLENRSHVEVLTKLPDFFALEGDDLCRGHPPVSAGGQNRARICLTHHASQAYSCLFLG